MALKYGKRGNDAGHAGSYSERPECQTTERASRPMTEPSIDETKPQGALLTDEQIKRLKVSIAVMSALLVIGIITLIGRVIYLASAKGDGAATGAAPVATNQPATAPLLSEATLPLPTGARLVSAQLQTNRLLAHYTGAAGDGLLVLDLSTGRVLSHIKVGATR
jgi:hypothetical protein